MCTVAEIECNLFKYVLTNSNNLRYFWIWMHYAVLSKLTALFPNYVQCFQNWPEKGVKGLILVLETVEKRVVLKRPQRALNRRTLDRYRRALDSWSKRALDRVLECSRLLSDSEGPGLVSEGPGTSPRGLRTWSQKALELFLRSIRSEPIFKGPGLVLEGLRQVLEGLTRTGFRGSRLASEGPGPVS